MFGISAASSSSKPNPGPPPFPTFLLPSLSIPFRRRRRSSSPGTQHHHHHPDHNDDIDEPPSPVPALSTSVDSTTSTSSPTTTTTTAPSSIPRTRRTSSTTTTNTTPVATLRCARCATDLAFAAQIVSKGFTGRHGRAFLVSAPNRLATPTCPASPPATSPSSAADLVNVRVGRPESRQLVTGAHVVADISCRGCGSKVGWKYVDAREVAQRYKVGKFILETARVVGWRGWWDGDQNESQDEEEEDEDEEVEVQVEEYLADDDDDSVGGVVAGEKKKKKNEKKGNKTPASKEDDEEEPVVFDSDDEDECDDIFAGTWDADAVRKRRRVRRNIAARKRT